MPATRNVFFALTPPPDVRAALAREAARVHADWGGRPTLPAKLHMTVVFLDAFPAPLDAALVERMREAAEGVAVPAFEVVVDRADRFGRRIGWLGCSRVPDGLRRLHAALAEAVAARGIPLRREEAYVPHVTILRDPRRPGPHDIGPVGWQVDGFVLMASAEGEYEVLGAWRL